MPIINIDKKSINQNELIPFKNAIDSKVSSVMVGHLVVPSLDESNLPATHSYKITTDFKKIWF